MMIRIHYMQPPGPTLLWSVPQTFLLFSLTSSTHILRVAYENAVFVARKNESGCGEKKWGFFNF